MDTKKIRFVATKPWLNNDSPSKPGPIIKTLPDWYRKAEWFYQEPDGGRAPTWKAASASCTSV